MTDGFEFVPRAATIHAGEVIEWRNLSRFVHSLDAEPEPGNAAALPRGAQLFASGDLQPGTGFR